LLFLSLIIFILKWFFITVRHMTNWNVVFGHTWTGTNSPRSVFTGDTLYDGLLAFVRSGLNGISNLPPQQRRIIVRRYNFGYRESDRVPNQIVYVHNGPLPWLLLKKTNALMILTADESHVFRVVRPSERTSLIRSFFDDMKDVKLNPHTLFDLIFRNKYLGVSRRTISDYLVNNASMHFFRTSKADGLKPVISSFRPKYPFEHWQMDFTVIGSGESTDKEIKLKNKKYNKLLVLIDIFSKFIYIFPTKDESAETVVAILNRLFLGGDIPKILHSDNGTSFRSERVRSLCEKFKIKQIFGTAYSPQTQGFVENKNHYIKKLIYTHFNRYDTTKFFDLVDRVAFTINNTKHSVTGYTPMQIHRGRELPVQTFEHVEGESLVLHEPSTDDLQSYVHRADAMRDTRVSHIKAVIDDTAKRREQAQLKLQTTGRSKYKSQSLEVGGQVAVATYMLNSDHSTSDQLQPILLTLVSEDERIPLRNPIRVGRRRDAILPSGRATFATKATKEPITKFLKLDYKVHKWYNQLISRRGKRYGVGRFNIHEMLMRTSNRKLYSLRYTHVDPDTRETTQYKVTWTKQDLTDTQTEWFHANMLIAWTDQDTQTVHEAEPTYPFVAPMPT
jgi:transposase InsO family protein